jgi:cephalosporin hydroxylase
MLKSSMEAMYSYNFFWLSRPIIQYPQDIMAMQEIIWKVRPDLIIETGIAHGGSLIMYASMLTLLDYCDAIDSGAILDPTAPSRRVIGIDVDIRNHNRQAIEGHPLSSRIDMIEGSSIEKNTVNHVYSAAEKFDSIMVVLDSHHTHDHVLFELESYAPLVSKGSYCIVFDTVIEDLPNDLFSNSPWSKGNNPKTAVQEYLSRLNCQPHFAVDGTNLDFKLDKLIDNKLMLTAAPDGYLRRI